jgi:hypothetical protein
MALTCLNYLSFEEFADETVVDHLAEQMEYGRPRRLWEYPLLQFSIVNWPDFVVQCSESPRRHHSDHRLQDFRSSFKPEIDAQYDEI